MDQMLKTCKKRVPYKSDKERRTKIITMRMSRDELAEMSRLAEADGMTLSAYMRERLALSKLTDRLSGF